MVAGVGRGGVEPRNRRGTPRVAHVIDTQMLIAARTDSTQSTTVVCVNRI
jgi:hypothetical protein